LVILILADGVNAKEGKEQGAGDQGLMFGFACDDTEELMPLPITLAHSLAKKLSDVRKSKQVSYLGPDGKCQVSVEYDDDKPVRLNTVLISAQHDAGVSIEEMKRDLIENVIMPVCADYFQDDTKVLINPSGKFVLGGPHADAGLTGRKIIVDTYGGMGRHGGGAFSGKDASKVDRSGAYMARYIAKNLVASGFCRKCEVQLAYAIGKPNPVSVYVNTFNTGKVSDDMFSKIVRDVFPLKPAEIIQHLKLKSAGFKSTSAYGHFGRNRFTWEKVDKVAELKEKLSSHCL
jgi:S-adenosylmethionine synthetase